MVCGRHGKNGAHATCHVETELKNGTEPAMDPTTVERSAQAEASLSYWLALIAQVVCLQNLKTI